MNLVPQKRAEGWFLQPTGRDFTIVLACVAAQAIYVLWGGPGLGRFTFPLDDAWIYQVYARNLALRGEWAFVAGLPSTGSTSVLWTPLLVPGHWLGLASFWWAQLMGLLCLIGAALGAARFFKEAPPLFALLIGLAVALDWHLVWAAASGMETALFAALLIWFWLWVRRADPDIRAHKVPSGLMLGLFGGVLMLARPEGLLGLAVAGLYGLALPGKLAERIRWGGVAGLGLAIPLTLFIGLNYGISGDLWPNTFHAKQTEYAVLLAQPYILRYLEQVWVSLVGAQLLLLPALMWGVWRAGRSSERWLYLLPLMWVALHWGVYAARLPVTFQHGRYAIPVMPILIIYGLYEMLNLIRPRSRQAGVRWASDAWAGAALALFPAMLIALGAPAFRRDAAFIDQEMVATAQWIAANTAPDAMIAAHDIGALGYLAPRPLLDLAGLVSPEVIPFMTDDARLIEYINAQNADYLIVFPGWNDAYARMVRHESLCVLWSADQQPGYVPYSPELGPLTIYRVAAPCPNI